MEDETYMACNEYCFIVYWISRQSILKEVDLTQNQETMTLQILITTIY